jgi:hypothetical protein
MKKIIIASIIILMSLGTLITNANAGKTLSVNVSCTIPSLLEMKIEPQNIESSIKETKERSERTCIQQEEKQLSEKESTQLISENKTKNKVIVYSFYER